MKGHPFKKVITQESCLGSNSSELHLLDQFVYFKEAHSRAKCPNSVPHPNPIKSASHRIIGIQYWTWTLYHQNSCVILLSLLICDM